MSKFTDFITGRYTDDGAGLGSLDFSNIAKDLGAATALYGVINPNDSSGLANFFGTGGQQQPIGYTGGIPNYTATRELAPNAFASTYTTPDGELATRRPGMAGRRYFTDTQFTQSTDEPFMGLTAEQITAQNQAAIDDQALFESILGNVETKRIADAATPAAITPAAITPATTTAATTPAATTAAITPAATTAATTAATGQLTPAQLKQAVLDDTMSYGDAYRQLGIADAVNPFGFTEEEQMALGIHESQRTGQGYKFNSATESMDLYDYDTGTFVTDRQRFTDLLDTQVDASDGLDEDEQKIIAAAITEGGFGIDEIATRYDAQPVDVVEGLLRGGFQTPEQIAAMSDEITEPQLIAALLEQGRTTPEEVAVYYKDHPVYGKDHPVYGGLTPESVIEAFRDLGGKRQFAQGGDINGYYLGGTTDGMADQVPATIDNMQPAALSDGEFVVPADVVSHLGNGNSDAGAQNLYSMMERVRTDRTGNPEQGRQIDPNKYLA